jgi:hypothetical protein
LASLNSSSTQEKAAVEKLKAEWKLLWSNRFDDKIRAEGVSVENYTALKVERGTIIHATRDCKALDFREVLRQNSVKDTDRFVQPHKEEGGWTKFAKKEIIPNTPRSQRLAIKNQIETQTRRAAVNQQQKKGGRGWLHTT